MSHQFSLGKLSVFPIRRTSACCRSDKTLRIKEREAGSRRISFHSLRATATVGAAQAAPTIVRIEYPRP
jgi:hypothetical protein